ncbi:SIR2 family protein [Clostridiales bacterium FE2011]|nr:SIR2 family protein [Clostridiales bacterium FE2011]
MRNIQMSAQRFIDHVKDGYNAYQRYCFILGAGASYTSGIRTGLSLIPEWRDYLLSKGLDYISECASDCGFPQDKWEHIFKPDYKPQSDDYFTLFDLRFAGSPVVAYHYLQDLMESAEPSIGYYMLAVLMEHTENKLVITTNFDSLVEDVLHMYHAKHPLVAGHESLAPFIGTIENTSRPIIAKVHRDLMLRPLNREEELDKLADSWKEVLQKILTKYTPIVIGYAGGDQTLMKLLEEMSLDNIYWCTIKDHESDRIENLLKKSKGGYLVKIKGFDEIMFSLASQMTIGLPIENPSDRIKKFFHQRQESYQFQFNNLNNIILDESTGFNNHINTEAKASTSNNKTILHLNYTSSSDNTVTVINQLDMLDKLAGTPEKDDTISIATTLRRLATRDFIHGNIKDALSNCNKAIELQPKDADLHHLKGLILHLNNQDSLSLNSLDEAIKLDKNNASYHDARSTTLFTLKRYDEALEESEKAIKLDPHNPDYRSFKKIILDKIHNQT